MYQQKRPHTSTKTSKLKNKNIYQQNATTYLNKTITNIDLRNQLSVINERVVNLEDMNVSENDLQTCVSKQGWDGYSKRTKEISS